VAVRARSSRQPVAPLDILSIKEAADLLEVSEVTLRRWDKSGKFSPHRHPVNGFRIYKRKDVLDLRRRIERGQAA
jgi:DNA-binding transcriptional MerR regulator